MATILPNCLGCSKQLAAADYQPFSDQPKICAKCFATMTPAERATRYENARIIYLLNAADINAEHQESNQIPVDRLARAIERLTVQLVAEQKRRNDPLEKN